MNSSYNSFIIRWLYTIAFMVFCMVFIGGVTRLTDSGLSMVDWRPLMGAIPPLSEAQWLQVFNDYKGYPEYQKINMGMSLSEFKSIFFWEYFHRLFGRLVGIVFFFPFVFLTIKKALNKAQLVKYGVAFTLGGLQGLLGWYMVKSGLVNRPDVSHFRLAAHLSLAFLIIAYLYWLVLEVKNPGRVLTYKKSLKKSVLAFTSLLGIQIIFGAFVAGLNAGLTHNTFPKMGKSWIPAEFYQSLYSFYEFTHNIVTIQFVHRSFAWLLLGLAIYLWFKANSLNDFAQKKNIKLMSSFVVIQFFLGVATLVMLVPISIASLHQLGACLLLLLCTRSLFYTFTTVK